MKKMFTKAVALCALLGSMAVQAQNLPNGFKVEKLCDLQSPTCQAFTPDGRIFIGEADGRVLVFQNGNLLSEPAFTVDNVKTIGEKGLIGIAVDPAFATNNYIYTFSVKNGNRYNFSLAVERYTIVNNKGISPTTIINLGTVVSQWYEIWNHNGGGIRFGNDGKLYIAVGYNDQNARIQDMSSYMSKIVRINSDGSAPTDNPYYSEGGNGITNRIYAYGMRNPFALHFIKGTNLLVVTDVGSEAPAGREEVNILDTGGVDLGFPSYQGYTDDVDLLSPAYAYNSTQQTSTVVESINGCALTGSTTFYPANSNYPDSLKNKIYIMDFCNGWLSYLSVDANGKNAKRMAFGSGLGKLGKGAGHVGLEEGIDGNLYFLRRDTKTPDPSGIIDPNSTGTLNRIVYDASVSVEASNKLLLNCTVQPNPAKDNFFINLLSTTNSKCAVTIYDMLGVVKQVNSFEIYQGENENSINISNLNKGTYLVNIKNDGKIANKKMVVE